MKNSQKFNSKLFLILTILVFVFFCIFLFLYIRNLNIYKNCYKEAVELMVGNNKSEKQIKWATVHPNYQKLYQGCLHSKGIK
jgi:capsular polysaccharide biosynthesis protein